MPIVDVVLAMKPNPVPNPVQIPFVTNNPPTLFVEKLLKICPSANNAIEINPAFLVPTHRMIRVFKNAAKAMKEVDVEPMKASVPSGARFCWVSEFWITPQE